MQPRRPYYSLIPLTALLLLAAPPVAAQTAASASCLSSSLLNTHGFWATAANLTISGVCTAYYANNGSCVNPNSTQTYLTNQQNWLNKLANTAYSFVDVFKKSFVFWGVVQGYLDGPNLSAFLPENVPNAMNEMVDNYYTLADSWIQTIQARASEAVAPCFQALANLTNGIYCAVTSNSNVAMGSKSPTFPRSIPLRLLTNATFAGTVLRSCLPLLDNYCVISFGISTSSPKLPFNVTFNLGDGGLTSTECQQVQQWLACNLTNCTEQLDALLTNKFATNWVPFVPLPHIQDNLVNYLNYFSNESAFAAIKSQPAGVGIGLIAGTSGSLEDFHSTGMMSGQPVQAYQRTAGRLVAGLLACLLVLVG